MLEKEKVKLKMALDEAETKNKRLTDENVNLNQQYKTVKDFANKIEDHYKPKKNTRRAKKIEKVLEKPTFIISYKYI
jgi:hypothetical protein